MLSWGGGLALIALGVVLLFVPGPGILLILLGCGLLARESRRMAAALDWAEPRVRAATRRARAAWGRASPPLRALAMALALAVSVAAAWLMYRVWLA